MKRFLHISILCALVFSCRVLAQSSLSLNLGSPGETITNALVFTGNGLTTTATAWSRDRDGGSFQQAQLVRWSPGIGVKSEGEAITNVPYVPFYTDNEDSFDFVLFVFDRHVEIDRLKVNPSGNSFDRDVSYWMGDVDSPLSLAGSDFSDLASLGFGQRFDDDSTVSNQSRWVDVQSATGGVNALLVGARVGGDSGHDRFKIQSLEVTTVNVIPEPSSLLMLGATLPFLFRRRRAA